VTSLVVLVDDAGADGGPAALLEVAPGRSVLDRLIDECARYGINPSVVLTRAAWRDAVAGVVPSYVPVIAVADTAGALASLAAHFDELDGPVLLAHGDVVISAGLLGDLVVDSRLGNAVLTRGQATGAGIGLLRVDAADRAVLAAAARDLSGAASLAEWDSDPAALLVTAARREGLAVGAVSVGEYVCERPRDPTEALTAGRRTDSLDEHRVRLRRVARPNDGFYSTFVVRRISPRLTELAVRRGWTPNAITLGALVIALAAAACFAVGNRAGLVTGALLLQVSLVTDCVDGETARYTRSFSALGAWLDATTDRIKEYVVYAALAIGSARSGDWVWTLATATLALQVFRNFVDFGFVATLGQRSIREVDEAAAGERAAALGRGAVALSSRTSELPALKWAKRTVFLPIGERWLIISVLAAVSGARAVFVALLALGLVSAVYATTGRVLRALAAPPPADHPVSARGGELEQMIDVGPLSRMLAARLVDFYPLFALALAAAAGLLIALVAGSGYRWPLVLGLCAVVVFAAPAWRSPPVGRFAWLEPGILRGLEYGLVVRVVAGVDEAAMPAAFGLLCAVAYHHYDTVYRWRHTGRGPAPEVFRWSLGWDGRLLALAAVLLVTNRLGPVLVVGAAVLAVVFVAESAAAWRAWLSTLSQPDRLSQG